MISCHLKHLEARCRERGYTLDEVRPCIVGQDGDKITVDETHPAYPRTPRPPAKKTTPPLGRGPGTELKALLAKLGIHASPTCKCNAMAARMDAWGEASLGHIEEIVDVMEETARKRGLPFLRTAGRILVRRAVSNASRKS